MSSNRISTAVRAGVQSQPRADEKEHKKPAVEKTLLSTLETGSWYTAQEVSQIHAALKSKEAGKRYPKTDNPIRPKCYGLIKGRSGGEYAIFNKDLKQYELGKGGAGAVKLAQRINDNELYALKTIAVSNPNSQRAKREHRILLKLGRTPEPEVIYRRSKKYNKNGKKMWKANLLMKYEVGAVPLSWYLDNEPNLPETERLKIVQAILRAYAELLKHNILHCDLKPDNILYNPQTKKATIIDFGIAVECDPITQKAEESLLNGTLGYIANELLPDNDDWEMPTLQTDIFALGIVFHEVMWGLSVGHDKATKESKFITGIPRHITWTPANKEEMYSCIRNMSNSSPDNRPNIPTIYQKYCPDLTSFVAIQSGYASNLKAYIKKKQALENASACRRFCLFFTNSKAKLTAAQKVMNLLEDKPVVFDSNDIAMLREKGSKLAKIIKELESNLETHLKKRLPIKVSDKHNARIDAYRMTKGAFV